MVVVVGFLMNGANFYGYVRCKLGSKQKISSVARNFLTAQFIRSVSMTLGIFYGYPTEWNKTKMPLFFSCKVAVLSQNWKLFSTAY